MKHVTEEYNQPCNYIICSNDEYHILKSAFESHGVIIRIISRYKDEIRFQIINPYKDYCWDHLAGNKIKELAEEEIKTL